MHPLHGNAQPPADRVQNARVRLMHDDVIEATAKPVPAQAHTSTELLEMLQGTTTDAPLCVTCGTKMRPAGSCYVCEGCGSTSGCS